MNRTIDGILNEAKTVESTFRVRVIKTIPGKLWNGEQKGIPAGVEFNVFHQDETHYYLQNDAKNYTAELMKEYFEVI
jgi:hypothetical protein